MSLGLPPNNLDPSNYRGISLSVIPVVTALREPTVTDTNYPLFCEWRIGKNPTSGNEGDFWKLLRFNQGQAGWEKISGGETGTVLSLSDTTDVVVLPDATGNVKLEGSAGIEVTSDPVAHKLTLSLTGGSTAIDSITPDTGVPIVADADGNITLSGQSTSNISGIETYAIGTNEIGLRLKSPFVGGFTFQSNTGGATETLLVENTVDQAGGNALVSTRVAGSLSGDAYYQAVVEGATSWSWGVDNSDSDSWVLCDGATLGGAANVMRADVSGIINFPSQPSAQAYISAPVGNVTGDGTQYVVIFDTVTTDRQSNYNATNGQFTCPRAGNYLVTSNVTLGGLAAGNTSGIIKILKNGSSIVNDEFNVGVVRTASNTTTMQANSQLQCAANDILTIAVEVSGGGLVVGVVGGDIQVTLLS